MTDQPKVERYAGKLYGDKRGALTQGTFVLLADYDALRAELDEAKEAVRVLYRFTERLMIDHSLAMKPTSSERIEIEGNDITVAVFRAFGWPVPVRDEAAKGEEQACSYPDCGCAEARLCMAGDPNEAALNLNRPRTKP